MPTLTFARSTKNITKTQKTLSNANLHVFIYLLPAAPERGEGEVMPEAIKLIQVAPVVRDENGFYQHPYLPDFGEDAGDAEKCKAWIAEQGLQVTMVSLEYHSDESVSERYFDAGDPDCSYWEPDRPDGEDWFCLAIHDTDDGPVCWWARREVTP